MAVFGYMPDGYIENPHDSELTARRSQVLDALNSLKFVDLSKYLGSKTNLKELWIERLKANLDGAIKKARERGEKTAVVLQFADAALDFGPDAEFTNAFFEKFGAVANIRDRKIPVSIKTLPFTILKDYQLPTVDNEQIMSGAVNTAISTKDGRFHSLVVGTNIDGVRIAMDGSFVHPADRINENTLRPYLLVSV